MVTHTVSRSSIVYPGMVRSAEKRWRAISWLVRQAEGGDRQLVRLRHGCGGSENRSTVMIRNSCDESENMNTV